MTGDQFEKAYRVRHYVDLAGQAQEDRRKTERRTDDRSVKLLAELVAEQKGRATGPNHVTHEDYEAREATRGCDHA